MRFFSPWRHLLIALAAIGLGAVCAPGCRPAGPTPPELPQVDASRFAPGVREQVQDALAAAQSSPDDPASVGRLGMVLHAYEEFASAAAAYERAGVLEPEKFAWRYYRAKALIRASRIDEGLTALHEAASLRPGYAPLWIELGDVMLAQGDPQAAIDHYRVAVEHDPGSVIGYYGLGQALRAQGETAAAAKQYRQALALAPRFGAAHYALGLATRDLGDEAQARAHIELWQRHRATSAPARDPLIASVDELETSAMTHTTRSSELARTGRKDEAVAELLAALRLDPDYLPAHANLIQLYSELKRFDEVERHYRAAMRGGMPAPTVRLYYARSLVNQQRPLDAVSALEELLAINPYSAEGNALLGSIRADHGQRDESIRLYRAALANAPGNTQANLGIGVDLVRRGEFAEAESYLQRALGGNAFDRGIVEYRIAMAYREAGRQQQALAYLEAARRSAVAADRSRLVDEFDRVLREMR